LYKFQNAPISSHSQKNTRNTCQQFRHKKSGINRPCHDWTNIQPANIELQIRPDELREELDTWLDVYGIDERYKAKCCAENDGKYWIEQVLDECQNDGRTPEQIFNTLARQAKLKPYADVNFLKFPLLEACNNKRLFDV
jgi:hypothetical protein